VRHRRIKQHVISQLKFLTFVAAKFGILLRIRSSDL